MGVLSCIPRHLKTIEIYTFRRHEKSQKNSNCYEKNVITKRKELAQWTKQLFYNFTRHYSVKTKFYSKRIHHDILSDVITSKPYSRIDQTDDLYACILRYLPYLSD